MKQKNEQRNEEFQCGIVELLDRDNYRHVLILDFGDMMEIRQCVMISYSLSTCILSLSPRRKIYLMHFKINS